MHVHTFGYMVNILIRLEYCIGVSIYFQRYFLNLQLHMKKKKKHSSNFCGKHMAKKLLKNRHWIKMSKYCRFVCISCFEENLGNWWFTINVKLTHKFNKINKNAGHLLCAWKLQATNINNATLLINKLGVWQIIVTTQKCCHFACQIT